MKILYKHIMMMFISTLATSIYASSSVLINYHSYPTQCVSGGYIRSTCPSLKLTGVDTSNIFINGVPCLSGRTFSAGDNIFLLILDSTKQKVTHCKTLLEPKDLLNKK